MKLIVDSEACEANGLTFEEFIVLYLNAKHVDIIKTMDSLVSKGIADKDLFDNNFLILGSKTRQLVERVLLDSDSTVQANANRIKNLAKTLQEMYIPGKKEGTQDYFRGNSSEIVQRLKRFFAEYGNFTDEEIIKATKKYIDSFNGNYHFAQLLKYFISKKIDGERGSRLLTYLENANQPDEQKPKIDWENELR